MTNPKTIRRKLARIGIEATVAEARLSYAADNLARNTADGYPTQASGTATEGGHTTAALTPVETATNQRLGDMWAILDHPQFGAYRPGPTTRLDDLNEHLDLALTALHAAHQILTICGVPPSATSHLRCVEYTNNRNCTNWKDPDRTDGRCIDHGRAADSNARRQRRHREPS